NPTGAAVILMTAFLVSLFLSTTFSFAWALGVLKPRFAFISDWAERWNEWKAERTREETQRKTDRRKAPKKQVIWTPREVSNPVETVASRAGVKPAPTPAA